MADIPEGFLSSRYEDTQGKQKKKTGKKYRKKYEDTKMKCERQKNKNKLLRKEMIFKEKFHTEREARCKAEGKAEAYKEIIEKITGSMHPPALPESVIEVDGEVRDV